MPAFLLTPRIDIESNHAVGVTLGAELNTECDDIAAFVSSAKYWRLGGRKPKTDAS